MEVLKKRILLEGKALPGNILKVDSFLNHQIDPLLMQAVGREFASRFGDCAVTRVLTLEASGIAPALFTGLALGVPVLFAKKTTAGNMDQQAFSAQVQSYTRGREYIIRVSRKYLNESDTILIIDDFLAHGQAALGLADIVTQAGASLAGIGIIIEKGFQDGGSLLRNLGIRVESLAIIKDMSNGSITFS